MLKHNWNEEKHFAENVYHKDIKNTKTNLYNGRENWIQNYKTENSNFDGLSFLIFN